MAALAISCPTISKLLLRFALKIVKSGRWSAKQQGRSYPIGRSGLEAVASRGLSFFFLLALTARFEEIHNFFFR